MRPHPDTPTLVAIPDGAGYNWSMTITKNGNATRPTVSCGAS
ncbi:hypothetical protein OG535_05240 [Kitasatospora sp. NBC_00085]